MKNKFAIVSFFISCFIIHSAAYASPSRTIHPNDLSFELGGRALLYSANYTRTINDDLSFGFGYGGVATNNPDGTPSSTPVAIIPVYLNFYLAQTESSPFFTIGGDLVTNSGAVNGQSTAVGGLRFSASPILLTFGLGYEYRSVNGLLVRLAAYGIYSSSLFPWGGLSFGFAF